MCVHYSYSVHSKWFYKGFHALSVDVLSRFSFSHSILDFRKPWQTLLRLMWNWRGNLNMYILVGSIRVCTTSTCTYLTILFSLALSLLLCRSFSLFLILNCWLQKTRRNHMKAHVKLITKPEVWYFLKLSVHILPYFSLTSFLILSLSLFFSLLLQKARRKPT